MFLRRGADGEDAFASARFSGLYPSCGLRRVWSANRGESPFQQVGPMGDEIIKDGGRNIFVTFWVETMHQLVGT